MLNPIRRIHQIEITSRCNLRCKYCVHPKMPRPKIDMEENTYLRALSLAQMCVKLYGQSELNLAGIGESTMHPSFVDWVHLAREYVGPDVRLIITTNGLLITDEMAKALVPAKPSFFVSLHRPEKAGPAVEILKRHNMIIGVSADPSVASVDWAGQVDWHVSAKKGEPCPWVRGGMVFVMADGRLSRCCFDGTGEGVIGTIWDPLMEVKTSPWKLCATCHLDVGA